MNEIETRPIKLKFPFRLYFKQLFDRDIYVRYLNPFSFWQRYRIDYLETCCQQNTVQHLKHCYQLSRLPRPISHEKEVNRQTEISGDRLIKQPSLNITLIIQPANKLKYRSVTYQTKRFIIVNVDYNSLDINSSDLNNCNNLNFNESNTPETFGSN